MINTNKQILESGDRATNYQAGRDIIVGLSYSDAKNLFFDLYEQNFIKLRDEAKEIAENRVKEFIEEFLIKAQKDSEINFDIFKTPAMQSVFYNAQVGYAKSGDETVKEQLIEALLERAKIEERNTQQIILDEVIETLSKLSKKHINFLSFIFFMQNDFSELIEIEKLPEFLNDNFINMYDRKFINPHFQAMLQYLKTIESGNIVATESFGRFFRLKYPYFFSLGFSDDEFIKKTGEHIENYMDILIPCLYDKNKFQFNAINHSELKTKTSTLHSSYLTRFEVLRNQTTMNETYIETYFRKEFKLANNIIDDWRQINDITRFYLSPIGTAIAVLNLNKNPNINLNLSDYI